MKKTWLTCPYCGKRSYPSRKLARKQIRARFPGEGMQVYRCGDRWHTGNPHGGEREQTKREPVREVRFEDGSQTAAERVHAARLVLPVLIERGLFTPATHWELTTLIGWDVGSRIDSTAVLGGARYLHRRGLAMPLGQGWVATSIAMDDPDPERLT